MLSGSDSLAGTTHGSLAPGQGQVLGGDCCGAMTRTPPRSRCVVAGWAPGVPSCWRRDPQLPETVSGRYLSSMSVKNIALRRAQGAGVREIVRRLGRAPSTIL